MFPSSLWKEYGGENGSEMRKVQIVFPDGDPFFIVIYSVLAPLFMMSLGALSS